MPTSCLWECAAYADQTSAHQHDHVEHDTGANAYGACLCRYHILNVTQAWSVPINLANADPCQAEGYAVLHPLE